MTEETHSRELAPDALPFAESSAAVPARTPVLAEEPWESMTVTEALERPEILGVKPAEQRPDLPYLTPTSTARWMLRSGVWSVGPSRACRPLCYSPAVRPPAAPVRASRRSAPCPATGRCGGPRVCWGGTCAPVRPTGARWSGSTMRSGC
ncbi:hypothetical protein ACFQ0M_05685 [Kitasatospora aburaviensis]